jgi:hypothetical protein
MRVKAGEKADAVDRTRKRVIRRFMMMMMFLFLLRMEWNGMYRAIQ